MIWENEDWIEVLQDFGDGTRFVCFAAEQPRPFPPEYKFVTADMLSEYLGWGWTFVRYDENGHAQIAWMKEGTPP